MKRYKLWFYVNGHLVHSLAMTAEELRHAGDVGYGMLKPADQWLMVTQDQDSPEAPWFTGNDEALAARVIPELFPGMKVPAGEMQWQKLHGTRLPPEVALGL